MCFGALILVMGLLIPAKAAQALGEIRVMVDFPDGIVGKGAVTLCYVGYPEGAHYRLTDTFGGGLVKREDAQSRNLAQWLAESIGENGLPRILDADGTAWFSHLEEGLYLLVQSETSADLDDMPPLLIPVPYENQWELVALPQYSVVMTQVPETGDGSRLIPAIGAMLLSTLGLGFCGWYRKKYQE